MHRNLTFADRLLLLRREMKLSQTAFADLLHIGRSWMSQLEKGEEPSPMLVGLFEKIEREWREGRSAGRTTEDHAPYLTGARAKLRHAREAKGLTQAQMAKQMGYSKVSTYIDIEEGRSQMGEKMARKAADLLGLDVSELMDGSDHPIDRTPSVGTFGAVPDIQMPPGMKAKFVPLISLAECGPDMVWTDDGYNGEGVLAIDCADPKAFAVKLSGDSMQPKYDAGDKAIVFPSAQPYNGDVVLAKLKEEHGGDVMIKLYQSSGGTVTLSSYNPVYKDIVWPRTAFAFIYPVDQILHSLRNRNR